MTQKAAISADPKVIANAEIGSDLAQKLDLLAGKTDLHDRQAGDVAVWPR